MDENSSTEIAPVLSVLETICRRRGVTVLILHHVNKLSASTTGGAVAQQAARGASALTDNARWQTNLSTMTKDQAKGYNIPLEDRKRWVQVDLSKCNYGPPLDSRWLYRGEGGILYGEQQLAKASPTGNQAKTATGKKGAANGSKKPSTRPDAIDIRTGW